MFRTASFYMLNAVTDAITIRRAAVATLYTNAFYLMANTAVMGVLGFLFWMVIARFYTEAEVGLSSSIISAISLIATLSLVGLNVSTVRFLPRAGNPVKLMNTCFTISGSVSLVTAVIFVVGIGLWSPALVLIKENLILSAAFIVLCLSATLALMVDHIS